MLSVRLKCFARAWPESGGRELEQDYVTIDHSKVERGRRKLPMLIVRGHRFACDTKMESDGLGIAIVTGGAGDRDALRPIVECWVRGRVSGRLLRNEVEAILHSIGSPETWHAVAVDGPTVLGVMGLTSPRPEVLLYAVTERPGEIVHAFVDPACARRGVGSLLASRVEDRAMATGLSELLVCSGPRYEASGWPFWSARYGEPVAIKRKNRGNTAFWRQVLV